MEKVFKEIKTIYIIKEMVKTEINSHINKKCYDCCHFKKGNMELYKLNLPNGIADIILLIVLWVKNIYVKFVEIGDITKKQSNIIRTLKGLMKEMLKMTF